MAGRPQGVQSFELVGTGLADQSIKANPGKLYSVNLSWSGATVDDFFHIHDYAGADAALGAAAAKVFTFRIPTAAGSFAAVLPAVGKEALVGLWLNLQSSGAKWSIDVGFD